MLSPFCLTWNMTADEQAADVIAGNNLLPGLLPPEISHDENDDMKKKPVTISVQVFVHSESGTNNVIESAALPEPNYPLDKAIAHLAARAAERLTPRKQYVPGHD